MLKLKRGKWGEISSKRPFCHTMVQSLAARNSNSSSDQLFDGHSNLETSRSHSENPIPKTNNWKITLDARHSALLVLIFIEYCYEKIM